MQEKLSFHHVICNKLGLKFDIMFEKLCEKCSINQ